MNRDVFSFAKTSMGYKHKQCEDFSGYCNEENLHICVVADGHGSDNYPRTNRGSRFAVEACIKQLKQFVKDFDYSENLNELLKDDENEILRQLAKSILKEWYDLVNCDVEREPFTEQELENVNEKYKQMYIPIDEKEKKVEKAYGTTLIAFVITPNYSFGIQIGDGKCVLVNKNGEFLEPIPWNEKCEMNITTSLCDSNAIEEFRFYANSESPIAVFCGSDGIDDSYVNMEEVYAFYRTLLEVFIDEGKEIGEKELEEYLPILTKRGSGDDVSVAMILDLLSAKKIVHLLKSQSEYFRLIDEKNKTEQLIKSAFIRKENLENEVMRHLKLTKLEKNKRKMEVDSADDDLMEKINLLAKSIETYEQVKKEILDKLKELGNIK